MDNEFRIEQFKKFYKLVMETAPEGFKLWIFPCEKNGKNPSPQAILKLDKESKGSWHHNSARLDYDEAIEHIKQGYNIGVSARSGDNLIIGDIDEKEYLDQVPKETLTTISRKRCGRHFFGWDKDGSAKINVPTDFGEMRSNNQYVLAPGSYVAFDLNNEKDKKAFEKLSQEAKEDKLIGYYTVGEEYSPREIGFDDLPLFFKQQSIEEEGTEEDNEYKEFVGEGKYSELFKLKVSDIIGKIPANKRVGHPLHESDTDANFSLSKDGTLGHCWRHLRTLNAVQFLCVKAGYCSCIDAGTPHKETGKPKKKSKIKGDKKALEVAYNEAVKMELIKEYVKTKDGELSYVDTRLEAVAKLTDPLEIENKLQKIKKETGFSIKILREKVQQMKKEYAKGKTVKDESLPCKVDSRFNEQDLLIHISNELDKDHIDDDREKLGTFLAGVSSKLPNPKDHVSVAHKGDSSSGKTNIQLSVVKHFPSESCGIATRITQSEMEDRINTWDILVVTEINKNREGANTEIVETFKAIMEDGIRIFKKDNLTGEPKEINVPQKTGFYATTETEGDDELETRYIIIPVRGSENKNRAVVGDTLSKVSNIDTILNKLKQKESWIAESIRGLDNNLDVVIPFAEEINQKFKTIEGEKELFDYSKERVKRDVKRLMSLTKAIAWIFQKRRTIIENKIIVAQPTDFLTALKIYLPFFNVSYSGLDPRISELLETIKNLEGKHSQEIEEEFGPTFNRKGWVIRTELQKKLGVSINTMKHHIEKLKDEGLIEVYWEQSHPKYYLIRPVNIPISRLLDPITLQALTGHLTGSSQVVDRYKKLLNSENPVFDTIPLVKNIEFEAPTPKLTGVKLTGGNSDKEQTTEIDFSEVEI